MWSLQPSERLRSPHGCPACPLHQVGITDGPSIGVQIGSLSVVSSVGEPKSTHALAGLPHERHELPAAAALQGDFAAAGYDSSISDGDRDTAYPAQGSQIGDRAAGP